MNFEELIKTTSGKIQLGEKHLYFPELLVGSGEVIALVGKNGTGKSVFLRHLMNWLSPAEGNIASSLWSQKGKIGWMSNKREQFADLWVSDVIRLGEHNLRQEVLTDVLHRFSLQNAENQSIQTLSDGEWIRVMMARFYYHQPPLIIMDEPTAHLDYHYKKQWETWVEELKDREISIICATHDLEWIKSKSDAVWYIQGDQLSIKSPQHFQW
jgi:ABC-type Mn2+/Zn2+ transport system ATPase subunit